MALFSFFFSTAYPQNFTYHSYTTRDGLGHNNVRAMVRDSSGYLWVGTWDGLSRFDGHEFRNYYHIARDSSSLPFFSVYGLFLDKYNYLWLLTDWMQLVRYHRRTDNFSIVRKVDTVNLSHFLYANTDFEGNLWIIKRSEIIKWDDWKKEAEVFMITDKNGKKFTMLDGINEVYKENDSIYWLAGPSTIRLRKTAKSTLSVEKIYPVVVKQPGRTIDYDARIWYRFYASPSGSKWIFSNSGLFCLDKKNSAFREYTGLPPAGEFRGRKYFFWGWRFDGINMYNSNTGVLTHISSQFTEFPMVILPDGQSSFWFSSTTQTGVPLGVKHMVLTPNYFENHILLDQDSAAPAVYAVAVDRYGNTLAGIRGSDYISRFAPDGTMSEFDNIPEHLQNKTLHVRSINPVEKGIWIGYFKNMFQFYSYSGKTFRNFFPDVLSTRALYPGYGNKVFLGDHDFKIYDTLTRKTEVLWHHEGDNNIFKFHLDKNGILWGGMAASCLMRYDTSSKSCTVIKLPTNNSNVEDIIEGNNGEIWMAMLGEGVCRYNQATGTFRFYTTSDGLSNNTTYNLLRDNSGNIWVSTNEGICRINPVSGKIRAFGLNDGLEISEFNSGAKFKGPDGAFYFGGMGGYVKFYPDSLSSSKFFEPEQKILLTDFEISGSRARLNVPLEQTDTIVLPKGEDNFHLTFSSTDFINPDNKLFRYRLSGINRNWIETGSHNRNINYSNLNPGWYTLTIEATDVNGDWSARKNIIIRVSPVYYETALFIILVSLLLVSAIALSIVFYVRNLKQKERQKQDELKLQSLRSQMNPHFIFNSLNSINYFISNNDRLSANRYIADFSRLIRSILANMGNNFIPFWTELNSIEDYLRIEHLRFADKFDYSIDSSQVKEKDLLDVCPGIIQPLIENAIWHGVRPLEGRKGFIKINFIPGNNHGIKCIIEDDGVGRKASASGRGKSEYHRSRGISLAVERLQIMSKLNKESYRLDISDLHPEDIETGTKVEVDIPVIINGR